MDCEVEKCLNIAKDCIERGDTEKAKRFLGKAKRLDASIDIEGLYKAFSNKKTGRTPNESSNDEAKKAEASSSTIYTDEQVKDVEKAKKAKDFYELLGLSREFKDGDLKKAYKTLALKFHPDKNKAPGATEIFKAVSRAYSTLSDPKKRAQYDMSSFSDKDIFRSNQSSRGPTNHFHQDEDFDAEELFQRFFGHNVRVFNGFGGGVMYMNGRNIFNNTRFRRRNAPPPQEERFNFLSLLPMILVFLGVLFGWGFNPETSYLFDRDGEYSISKQTANLGVTYYVKSSFENEYVGAKLANLERKIEHNYISLLSEQCNAERKLEYQLYFASFFNPMSRNRDIATPACDKLRRFGIRI